MSVASRWAGWDRWQAGPSAGPMVPAGEPSPGPVVELFYDDAWHDITGLGLVRASDGIQVRRGRLNERGLSEPASCQLTLDSRDGRFSPRLPTSPLYGKIGRNTPLRVSMVRDGIKRVRFVGEVSAWPVRADISGTDITIDVEAAGPMRRLEQGDSPLNSVMYRALTRVSTVDTAPVVAYWPVEDADTAEQIASGLPGASPMVIRGTPTLATDSSFVCSDALPTMGSASFTGHVANYSSATTAWQVRFLMKIPAGGATDGQIICTVHTTGSIVRWELYYGTGGTLGLRGFDGDGTNVADTGAVAFAVDGDLSRISIEVERDGSSVDYAIVKLDVGASSGNSIAGTEASATAGRVSKVVLAQGRGLTDTVLGHLSVQSAVTSIFDLDLQLAAYSGERAWTRAGRLAGEEGVDIVRVTKGIVGNTTSLGYQPIADLLTLLQQIEASDDGYLYETRDQLALAYRVGLANYNQAAALTLSQASHQLAAQLAPIDDDRTVRNDVTVTRVGGSSARSELTSGALSTATPPDGVGRYDEAVSLSLASDTQVADQASWRLHLGTVDEPRYPAISVNLMNPAIAGDAGLVGQILEVDVGDRIVITDPPAWLPPDDISLIVLGYSEQFDQFNHMITFNCAPESPYHAGVYGTSKYDTDGSTLTSDVASDATSISITTTTGPVWTQDGAQFPFDVAVDGERMTVTAVSGSSSPQTFTVTRGVNTVSKSHPAGAAVALWSPVYYRL